ncbi:NF-X1-type zinc finger protein NFXL1 [Acorus gramineus]|uniref:NF-X1-type zinc finger protein NFXL1 n=1 Tax=Acorus gramineus TaxID=55184 RepID=A0AAV9BML2_ACOGR|nr:NF-X1-type zinc finger protein NFXL1 [Acorus gramineus]
MVDPALATEPQPRINRRNNRSSRIPNRGGGGNLQQWVPRGSDPIVPVTPAPDPINHHPRRLPPPSSNPVRRTHAPRNRGPSVAEEPQQQQLSVPQLVQEIQDKLAKGSVECMICYDMVRRSAPVWSCSSCYSIFHLHCIKKWARAPTSGGGGPSSSDSSWRCPGCQSVQTVPSKDLQYTCFCGRRRDPPSDFYLTPHSCGEPCGKPLDHTPTTDGDGDDENRCPHNCVLQCHPGPCPPCKAFAPRRPCPCGKRMIARRCADRTSALTCGMQCDRVLDCGRHRCGRTCHVGPCEPCGVSMTASCFCGKSSEVIVCGEMVMKGEVVEGSGVFSCEAVCGRVLSCGNHSCVEKCHPGPCGECEFLPKNVKTCPCGKAPLEEERRSCLDPIPTCSDVCGKLLRCRTHRCKDLCHEGDCKPCLTLVVQKCRCGSSSRTTECYKTIEDDGVFICEKPCGRKKNCGRHRCSERCCPLSEVMMSSSCLMGGWDPHLCSMLCGKKLRCGQHTCRSLCHSGHCPPCLETIFTDLTCACGRTSIPPPLPCGTQPPTCPHTCPIPQPCGHPASHGCHFGDCPPCTVPVSKGCVGGHVVLRNVPCGSRDIRCNQLCGKTRCCGMHACARSCHPPPCDAVPSSSSGAATGSKVSCGQVCGAPRRDCKHTCTSSCHPSSLCPDLRCEFPVMITCSCGRITSTVPCDAGGGGGHVDPVFEASIIQKLQVPLQPVEIAANGHRVPLGQRKLMCDEECTKAERRKVLADAFDITPINLDTLHFGESSTVNEVLTDLFRREPKWVLAVEERFKFLVLGKGGGSNKGGISGLKVHVFCAMIKEKRDAIRLMAERWKLHVQAAGWEPRRFLVVHVTPKSKAPARILGPKGPAPVNGPHPQPVFDSLIDMDPKLVVSLLDLPSDADISALVLRFGGECELVWLNDKNALAVFADPSRAATALRRLDNGSAYHGAVVVLQSSSGSNNVWGGSKEPMKGSSGNSNPWKKAVLMADEDSWVWPNMVDAPAPPARRENEPPIALSTNRWNVLNSDGMLNLSDSSSVNAQDLHRMVEGPSALELPVAGNSSGGQQDVRAGVIGLTGEEELDDWEMMASE